MLILKITKENKNAVFVMDTGETFNIHYEVFLKSALRKGDEVTEEQITALQLQNQVFLATEQAFRFLSIRLHSINEIERKLSQKKYSHDVITAAIKYLLERNYLDDEKFTLEFIEERRKLKKTGSRKIRQELLAKGVAKSIIDSLLTDDENSPDVDNALEVARKKLKFIQKENSDMRKIKQKLYNFLISKGFSYDIATQTLNQLLNTSDE